MIETSFEYPKNIGVLNYNYVEMDDSSENDCLLNNTNKNPYGTKQQNEKTLKYLEGKTPKKIIVVPGKIVNIVV